MTTDPSHNPRPSWNGAPVGSALYLRRTLNRWRLCAFVDDGIRVEFYRTRRGVVIVSVKAVAAW